MSGDPNDRSSSTKPTRQRLQLSLLTLLALVGMSACLFRFWKTLNPPTRVYGIVTYEGKPIGSAVILFEPLDPTGRKVSGAVVQGKYEMDAGVQLGSYAIGIRDSRKELPAKYNLPKTSGISARVMDAQFNRLDFDLR
jgi:hypothetical protein